MVASVDICLIANKNYDEVAIEFVFPLQPKVRKKYEKKLKKRIKEILVESGYTKRCKEIVWMNNQYNLIPMK